jgi:hypothetical protein
MKKAPVCALEMVQEWAPESEKLLVVARKMKKALVLAIEAVRDYAPKSENVVFRCVNDDEGSGVGARDIQEKGARSFERMLNS